MKKSLKKKIFLSNLLEQVEINRDTKKIIFNTENILGVQNTCLHMFL